MDTDGIRNTDLHGLRGWTQIIYVYNPISINHKLLIINFPGLSLCPLWPLWFKIPLPFSVLKRKGASASAPTNCVYLNASCPVNCL